MRVVVFAGLCLLAFGVASPALAQSDDARSQHARAELDALRDRIDTVRQQIAQDKSQRSDLSKQLTQAEADISAASKRLRELDDAIANARKRVAELTRRRDREREKLGDQLAGLREQVRAAHASGQMDKMRLLLSGQSPEKLGRMLVYYEYFANARSEQVTALRSALADLAVRQNALENEQTELARQRAARQDTLASLKANQAQREQAIAALDRQLSGKQASLSEMRADEQRLRSLMGRLRTQLSDLPPEPADDTPFGQLKGRMQPPVSGPVLARFGTAKAGGPLKWQGEWLGADAGTPVRAVAAGRVVYVGYMHRYGLIVVIDHGNDYYTLYGHAESTYVEVGDRVERGQAVAKAGHSGGHTQNGAYFELRRGRTPINPASWLAG
ncbi:peptidase M23B [Salinisphaera sp. T5B8]|uniref:murein hydrolase activator EnvC family protein n=1 Tax=unclassified Salinisphaera TaxID=2649847 RepID=UPI003341EC3A